MQKISIPSVLISVSHIRNRRFFVGLFSAHRTHSHRLESLRPLLPPKPMWRIRLSRAWDWLRSRRLVGEDEHHLYYTEFIEKGKPERRYVEYKDQNITHSSDRMPIEWWSWLHSRRDDTPSAEEIASSEARQARLAERVAILEAEDEKQRLRQFAGSVSGKEGSMTEDEMRAKRRNNVMMQLARAATPKENGKEVVATTETEHISGILSDGNANTKEDPQVRSCGVASECTTLAFVPFAECGIDLCVMILF